MVRFVAVLSAAALLSQSAFAAPTLHRRDGHKSEEKQTEQNKQKEYEYEPEQQYQYEGHDTRVVESTSIVEEPWSYEAPPPSHETPVWEKDQEYEWEETPEYEWEGTTTVDSTSIREHHSSTSEPHKTVETNTVDSTSIREHSTTEYEWEETTSVLSTRVVESTSVPEPWPTYGSGNNNWGTGYDDCVSQCMADYGKPPAEWVPPKDEKEDTPPSGAVHTVLVAPKEGVLRFYPFSLNATVGDTVRYVWSTGANHTATLSSELAICNRSAVAESRSFVSGIRKGPDTFDVVVSTDEPQFFYCSVGQHCDKGMFGILNPKSEFGGVNTVGSNWGKWISENPDLKAAWGEVSKTTKDTDAHTWGNTIDISGVPEDSHYQLAANVIWTRAMLAANPGTVELGLGANTPDDSPISLVDDITTLLTNTNPNNEDRPPAGTPTGEVPNPSDVAKDLAEQQQQSGALRVSAGVWVAGIVGVVSYLML